MPLFETFALLLRGPSFSLAVDRASTADVPASANITVNIAQHHAAHAAVAALHKIAHHHDDDIAVKAQNSLAKVAARAHPEVAHGAHNALGDVVHSSNSVTARAARARSIGGSLMHAHHAVGRTIGSSMLRTGAIPTSIARDSRGRRYSTHAIRSEGGHLLHSADPMARSLGGSLLSRGRVGGHGKAGHWHQN